MSEKMGTGFIYDVTGRIGSYGSVFNEKRSVGSSADSPCIVWHLYTSAHINVDEQCRSRSVFILNTRPYIIHTNLTMSMNLTHSRRSEHLHYRGKFLTSKVGKRHFNDCKFQSL